MTNLCDLLPRANQVSSHVEWKQLANVLHDNCRPYACNHKRTVSTQILQCEFQEKMRKCIDFHVRREKTVTPTPPSEDVCL